MYTLKLIFLLLTATSIHTKVAYSTEGLILKFCQPDVFPSPWLHKDKSGLLDYQIKYIEKKMNMKIETYSLPWNRCILETTMGQYDAIIGPNYSRERDLKFSFPKDENDQLIDKYRLKQEDSIVLVNKNSNISWKNNKFKNIENNSIAVSLGFASEHILKDMNIKTYTSFHSIEEILDVLNKGSIKVAVLQKSVALANIRKSPSKYPFIRVEEEPFTSTSQFLAFNKIFYSNRKELVFQIWTLLEEVKKDPGYIKLYNKLMN